MCASLWVANPNGRNESERRSDPPPLARGRRTIGASRRSKGSPRGVPGHQRRSRSAHVGTRKMVNYA